MHLCLRRLLRTSTRLNLQRRPARPVTFISSSLGRTFAYSQSRSTSNASTINTEQNFRHVKFDAARGSLLRTLAHWPWPEAQWRNPDAWMDALDALLAREHRVNEEHGWNSPSSLTEESLRSVYTLIVGSSMHAGIDLISHACIKAGRWELVDQMIWAVLGLPSQPLDALGDAQPFWVLGSETPGSLDGATDRHPVLKHLKEADPHIHPPDGATKYSVVELLREADPRFHRPYGGTFLSTHEELLLNRQWAGQLLDLPAHLHQLAFRSPAAETMLGARLQNQTLDQLTDEPLLLSQPVDQVRHKLLGHLWGALGHIILAASQLDKSASKDLMKRVVVWIARFQHHGLVPDEVYQYKPNLDSAALTQPPLLHQFSSKIFGVLSDANFGSLSAMESESLLPDSMFYISRPRFKIATFDISYELWMELILWTCIHGGWVLECSSVLMEMSKVSGDRAWSLICWKDAIEAEHGKDALQSEAWLDESKAIVDQAGLVDIDRSSNASDISRTLSSEAVSAFVDILVHSVRPFVGDRGLEAGIVLDYLLALKELLEKSNVDLIGQTWDSVIARIADSEGLSIERDTDFMLKVLLLAQPHGMDLNKLPEAEGDSKYANTSVSSEPSASTLGFLHLALHAHLGAGNMAGAYRSLSQIQSYTDLNKLKSVERFFSRLASHDANEDGEGLQTFNSSLLSLTVPNYYPQIPSPIMADVIELATKSKAYELVEWLLFSEDIDGALVPPELYADPILGPAIIAYASAREQKALVATVLQAHSSESDNLNPDHDKIIPVNMLVALLTGQVERRRWGSVANILFHLQNEVLSSESDHAWRPRALVVMAREMVRHVADFRNATPNQQADLQASASRVADFFRELLENGYKKSLGSDASSNDINTILAVLSTVRPEWRDLASTIRKPHLAVVDTSATNKKHAVLRPLGAPLTMTMSTADFNILLEAIADLDGSVAALRLWTIWCDKIDFESRAARRMPLKPVAVSHQALVTQRAVRAQAQRTDVVVTATAGEQPVAFRGRILPGLSTVRIILRKAMEELMPDEPEPEPELEMEAGVNKSARSDGLAALEAAAKTDASANVRLKPRLKPKQNLETLTNYDEMAMQQKQKQKQKQKRKQKPEQAQHSREVFAWAQEVMMAMGLSKADMEFEMGKGGWTTTTGHQVQGPLSRSGI